MAQTQGPAKKTSRPAVTPVYDPEVSIPSAPGVKLEENVYVEMRDGIKLAVDIYSPKKEGRYPALLSMAPYLKEIQQHHPGYCHSIEAGATSFFVPKGYIHVICQVRGSGMSQGQWGMMDIKEQQDGYDMIEWIASQPWCNGNVAMIGDSYWAWIQYGVAAQQPPHLKCIVPHDGGTDFYRDVYYQGGIFRGGDFANHWVTDTFLQCVWPGKVEGKLPPINLIADLAMHPEDGPYYWERSSYNKVDKIKVPALLGVCLTNNHSRGQLQLYQALKAPKKLLVAPETGYWAHLRFITNKPLCEYVLRWLDHWLKGKNNGIMDEPEVAIYDPAAAEWRYENEYPLKRTEWKKFYLHSDGAGPAADTINGSIDENPPKQEKPDKYQVPECISLLMNDKPVLVYSTPPLESDLRVWGPLSITLYGSSSAIDTTWFVKVYDIVPGGKPRYLNRGLLRASFREVDKTKSKPGQPVHSFQKPALLEPNIIYEYQIEINPIFYTFKKGHQFRVEIASEDMVYFGSLHSIDVLRLPWPALNAIYHDASHPSHLLLPVIPDAPVIRKVEPPLSEVYWTNPPGPKWPSSTDMRILLENK
jgi:predicted acyl esterase